MENSKILTEFRKKANQRSSDTVVEQLEKGVAFWYRGCPIEAPDDIIALRVQTGLTIQIKLDDVIEIEKEEDQYLVQVKEGANAVVGYEFITGLKADSKDCECDDDSEGKEAKMLSLTGDNFDFEDIFEPPRLGFYACYLEPVFTQRCYIIRDKCGNLKRICIPYMTYRRVCRWF